MVIHNLCELVFLIEALMSCEIACCTNLRV